MASQTASTVRLAALRSKCLSLAKSFSMGLRSDEYLGRKMSLAPALRIAWRTALPLWLPRLSMMTMSPGWERGNEDLLYVDQEPLAVDRTVDQPGCLDPIVAQRGQEGHGLPVTVRRLRPEPLSARRPAPERRHVCLGPGLVDEDQTGRINPALILPPLRPTSRDVGTILFAGEHGFF